MSVEQPIDHPPIASCWREVARREDLSGHDSLDRVLDACEGAGSLWEAAHDARIRRGNMLGVVTWLGLAESCYSAGSDFPPADLDKRVAKIRRGLLPSDARARDWRPEAGTEADRDA